MTDQPQPVVPTPADPGKAVEPFQAASQNIVDEAKMRSMDFMNPIRWEMMQKMATTFISSGALPSTVKNAPQLIMMMQAGYEAGMQPIESLSPFYFVNGKISMYGDAVISQVLKAGHKVIWGECSDKTATVTIERGDDKRTLSGTFTMDMVKSRGLDKNEAYHKYPENMLKFKAFHMTAKFICPEALHGVTIKEVAETEIEVLDDKPTKAVKGKRVVTTETEPAIEGEISSHKPLNEELDESENQPAEPTATPKPSDKVKNAMRKKAEDDGVEFPDVLTNESLTDLEKADKLIEQELSGKKLTVKEIKFVQQQDAKRPTRQQ